MNKTEKPTKDQLDQLDERMIKKTVLLRGPEAEALRGLVKDVMTKQEYHQSLCDDRAAAVIEHGAWQHEKMAHHAE